MDRTSLGPNKDDIKCLNAVNVFGFPPLTIVAVEWGVMSRMRNKAYRVWAALSTHSVILMEVSFFVLLSPEGKFPRVNIKQF